MTVVENNFMREDWLHTKKEFRTGLFASLLISFLLLIFPGNRINTSQENFLKQTVVLDSMPVFTTESHGKSGTEYFVKLRFKGDRREFRITHKDYNFLDHEAFSNITAGDTIQISRNDKNIHSFVKNNYDYLNYTKAETNRGLTIYFLGFLFLPMIPYCLLIQFFKKRPSFIYNGETKFISFPYITISLFVITAIVLIANMPDFIMVSSGEFYK